MGDYLHETVAETDFKDCFCFSTYFTTYPVGIEVVTADLDDPKSLKVAVTGAYGVFAVTNYWEHLSGEKELQQVLASD